MFNPMKALLKLVARNLSDNHYNKEEKKVQNSAYLKVGKDIQKAKKNGCYFDASKAYQNKYNRYITPINQKKSRRDKFIDDI